jgi:hypothetical protein
VWHHTFRDTQKTTNFNSISNRKILRPTMCVNMQRTHLGYTIVFTLIGSRGQLKCDGTRAETRFRLSAKRKSPFKSAGASVQSTTGSRGVPSAVVMLYTPGPGVMWRVLATHAIRQSPLHFPTRASPCAITFQLESATIITCCLTLCDTCSLNTREEQWSKMFEDMVLRISGPTRREVTRMQNTAY